MGNNSEALKVLEKSLEINPKQTRIKELISLLKRNK